MAENSMDVSSIKDKYFSLMRVHESSFHDFLAAAILEWRRDFLEQKQKQQEKKQKQQQLLQRLQLSGVFLGLGAIALLGWQSLTAYRQSVDLLTAESQQALRKFYAGQQLVALQQAIRTGRQVQSQVQVIPSIAYLVKLE
jgi:TorA maturation chaperone TorD